MAPICTVGMCVEFFNFTFCLTKPNSIPECPSSLALRKLQLSAQPSSFTLASQAPPVQGLWSQRPQGQGGGWARRGLTYVFFQIKTQPYFSLQKQKRKPKKIPTFELHLSLSCLHLLCSGARQGCVYVLGEGGWRHIHSIQSPG